MGYSLMFNSILVIIAIVYFSGQEHEFKWCYFWKGGLASLFGTIGSVFIGKAIETGAALGPIFTLLNL